MIEIHWGSVFLGVGGTMGFLMVLSLGLGLWCESVNPAIRRSGIMMDSERPNYPQRNIWAESTQWSIIDANGPESVEEWSTCVDQRMAAVAQRRGILIEPLEADAGASPDLDV
jgi:hypothetical protein